MFSASACVGIWSSAGGVVQRYPKPTSFGRTKMLIASPISGGAIFMQRGGSKRGYFATVRQKLHGTHPSAIPHHHRAKTAETRDRSPLSSSKFSSSRRSAQAHRRFPVSGQTARRRAEKNPRRSVFRRRRSPEPVFQQNRKPHPPRERSRILPRYQ